MNAVGQAMPTVRVKICGVTRLDDALAAADAGADLIGLNFHPPSPRFVALERAREIGRAVAGRAKLAGVFVAATREVIARACAEIGLDFVQLYDDEQAAAIADLPVAVIRALRLKPGTTPEQFAAMLGQSRATHFLLDSYDSNLYGGTGKRLDPSALAGFDLSRGFIAGGLTPENVAEAAALNPYGVDVAGGVESAPGVKDHDLIRSFIRNAKSSR
jgi:phosphoribosylanthranilate isomerase